jgi:hypothetical protein
VADLLHKQVPAELEYLAQLQVRRYIMQEVGEAAQATLKHEDLAVTVAAEMVPRVIHHLLLQVQMVLLIQAVAVAQYHLQR